MVVVPESRGAVPFNTVTGPAQVAVGPEVIEMGVGIGFGFNVP
jgi:hypothetical protein